MSITRDTRLKLVGEVFPYVFIESVSVDKASYGFSEDHPEQTSNEPTFTRNEFGNNKQKVHSDYSDNNTEAYSVTLTLSLNDFLNNSKWYNTSTSRLMKIKILQATSKRAFDLIRGGNFYNASDAPANLRDHVLERVIQVPVDKQLSHHAVKEIEGVRDTLCTIKIKENFIVSKQYLGFVVFPYLERPAMFGAKNSRRVVYDGKIDSKSYSFYSPDGTQWKGLVHRHPDKGVMEGRFHSKRPHNVLTVVEHSNNVKDYRIFDKFAALQNDLQFKDQSQQDTKFYSELFLTPDDSGAVRGFFAFDMVGFLKSNSEFDSFVNKRNLKKLMALTRIQQLTVFRDTQNDYESAGTRESDAFNKTRKLRETVASFAPVGKSNRRIGPTANVIDSNKDGVPDKTVGTVSELTVSGLGNKRGFSFVDLDMSDIENGSYIYGAEITIEDPTIDFFKTQLFSAREARNVITSYVEKARLKNNFNSNKGEFSHTFLNNLKVENNLSIIIKGKGSKKAAVPWRIAPKIYFSTLENLTGISIPKSDKKALQKLLYPSTGDLRGVEQFVALLDSLIKKLEAVQKTPLEVSLGNNIRKGFFEGAGAQKPSSLETYLRSEKVFATTPWEATKYYGSRYRLDYLKGAVDKSQYSLVNINRNSLVNRFNVEVGKYFPEAVGKREDQVSNELLEGFRSVYFSALTPTSILSEEGEIVLSGKIQDSYEKAAKVLGKSALLASTQEPSELLANIGAKITKSSKNKNKPASADVSEVLGDSLNSNKNENEFVSSTYKDSFADRTAEAGISDDFMQKVSDIILDQSSGALLKDIKINSNSSIQERYIKNILDDEAYESARVEAGVLAQTLVSVKYITGFDSNMSPIYSTKIPHSRNPSIYVLEPNNNSGGQRLLINDSVGVVQASGETATEQDLREDSPRNNPSMSMRVPEQTSKQIQVEDPCPDGYIYNLELGACIEVPGAKVEAQSIDEADPVTEDAEYGSGQVYQMPSTMETSTAMGGPTASRSSAAAAPSAGRATTTSPSVRVGTGGGSYGY